MRVLVDSWPNRYRGEAGRRSPGDRRTEGPMTEEHRPMDPTRRMLRVFGVTVTDYEEKTARILNAGPDELTGDELLRLSGEAVELTAKLNGQLREMNAYLLELQSRVLARVNTALVAAQHSGE